MASGWISRIAVGSVLAMMPGLLLAAPARDKAADSSSAASATTVEMFQAMKEGQIEVKLIPKDSTESRVLITNKTDQPLSIKLPSTFAGVPVLAQAAGAGGGRSGNQNQSTGGGMDLFGGGGGGGGGGGFFNIAPEKVGQLKVTTVCLEHGKKEPHAAVPYEIKPLEEVSQKPEVQELCRMLGAGKIPQRVAQVAAWHLNNDMSWEQLANKQLRFANGSTAPYFSPQEIQAALRVVAMAHALVQEKNSAQPTSEKKGSLSQ